jgi:hypothetical protein
MAIAEDGTRVIGSEEEMPVRSRDGCNSNVTIQWSFAFAC